MMPTRRTLSKLALKLGAVYVTVLFSGCDNSNTAGKEGIKTPEGQVEANKATQDYFKSGPGAKQTGRKR